MKFFFLILVIWSCSNKTHGPQACLKNPPFDIKGCEGESCSVVYDEYPSNQEFKLFRTTDTNSDVMDTINECEKFKDLKHFLVISDFNEARVTKAEGQLKKYNIQLGDIIKITHYTGEGTWGACIGNDIIEGISIKGKNILGTYDEAEFLNKEIKRPKSWVYVTSLRKRSGWTDKVFWQGKNDDEQILLKKCNIK